MDVVTVCLVGVGLCLVAIFWVLARYAARTWMTKPAPAAQQVAVIDSAPHSYRRRHSHLPSVPMTLSDDSSFRDTDAAVYVSSWPADVLAPDDSTTDSSSASVSD